MWDRCAAVAGLALSLAASVSCCAPLSLVIALSLRSPCAAGVPPRHTVPCSAIASPSSRHSVPRRGLFRLRRGLPFTRDAGAERGSWPRPPRPRCGLRGRSEPVLSVSYGRAKDLHRGLPLRSGEVRRDDGPDQGNGLQLFNLFENGVAAGVRAG